MSRVFIILDGHVGQSLAELIARTETLSCGEFVTVGNRCSDTTCCSNLSSIISSFRQFFNEFGTAGISRMWAELDFRRFLDRLSPPVLDVNPLPILMRAVNAVALRAPIKLPRWRKGRWRSKT